MCVTHPIYYFIKKDQTSSSSVFIFYRLREQNIMNLSFDPGNLKSNTPRSPDLVLNVEPGTLSFTQISCYLVSKGQVFLNYISQNTPEQGLEPWTLRLKA